jgi:beta-N-acetylhexosaminidase
MVCIESMMDSTRLPLSDDRLTAAPFHLDAQGLAWVKSCFAKMDSEAKIAQIVLPMCRDLSDAGVDAMSARQLGGVHRFPSYTEAELRGSASRLQARSAVPPLLPADIEMSEKASVKSGTAFPNQMAVAATNDPQNAYRMAAIAAREAGFLGFNISWTPVVDLALNFRSNAVNTRAFSQGVEQTIAMMSAYLAGMADNGLVACVKHFPGDGLDERDQHFVTTHNSMTLPEWQATFGRIFAAAIAQDVRLVMAGHITLAAYSAAQGDAALGEVPLLPASLNADLLQGLLRRDLGYNGVIVSDATGMAGFTSCGVRRDIVPLCIESGCDILLFPRDIDEDIGFLRDGLASGALSQARLDQAVLRVLALKASMGLHLGPALPAPELRAQRLGSAEHQTWAREVARGCVTLVKDRQALLPLSPKQHRRILLAEIRNRRSPSASLPDLEIPAMLEALGFEITRVVPGQPIDPRDQDIGLYLIAEEGLSGREVLGPRWEQFHGAFPLTMQRMWQHLPTVFVSLGSPFLLFHMPDCPTFVNGYSAVLPVQRALVDALTGVIPFRGQSPVDVSCGLLNLQKA